MTADIELRGERLVLRADRSLEWPAQRTLMIADPHFGKSTTFRALGVPVPGGIGKALSRLGTALAETGSERLVILGDFWHARQGRSEQVLAELTAWRLAHRSLAIELIQGNHDRGEAPPSDWGTAWNSIVSIPPFVFGHHPHASEVGYVLAGHLHPGIVLRGSAKQRLRLPCFWFGAHWGVLPAFGTFTGLKLMNGEVGRAFAIAGQAIVEIPHTS